MSRRSWVWCVCMSGSLAHFWRVCVSNHTPFSSFALLNSSHHGAIQSAANSPTCSLGVSLLSADKRNKCLKSNVMKKKRRATTSSTLQAGLSHRLHNILRLTGSYQVSLSQQPLCFISPEIDIPQSQNNTQNKKKKQKHYLLVQGDFQWKPHLLACKFLFTWCAWKITSKMFQSSIGDKWQPDSIPYLRPFETNKLIKQLSRSEGLDYWQLHHPFHIIICLSSFNDHFLTFIAQVWKPLISYHNHCCCIIPSALILMTLLTMSTMFRHVSFPCCTARLPSLFGVEQYVMISAFAPNGT